LQVWREGGRYRARIGARRREGEILDDRRGALTLRAGGRTFDVTYWKDGGELHLDLGGSALAVEILDPLRSSEDGNTGGEISGKREIRAAMPGKVVAIKARVGEAIHQGQGVVVVEAMKMENEVLAPGAGTIVSMEVAPGQTVEKGTLLFSIE
jgi:acetyl/propionyl-CoA carboxylase alpha subunit